jgi:hypothetical protein
MVFAEERGDVVDTGAAQPQPIEKRGHGITLKHTEKIGKKILWQLNKF